MTIVRKTGSVKSVKLDRGFGFISVNGGRDVFFHRSSLTPGLEFSEQLTGQRVEFELQNGQRGPLAVNIRGL